MPHQRKRRTSLINRKTRIKKINFLINRDGNRCWWCHEPFTEDLLPTIDHLIPRVAGGTDANTNIVLACASCNNGRANPPLGRRREKEDGVVIIKDKNELAL